MRGSLHLSRVSRPFVRVAGFTLITAAAAVLLLLATGCPSPLDPQALPSDARDACPLSSTTFAGWFESGSPTLNGVVNPADSLNFPDQPNCPFYEWSEHMFLWLTSPAPATYGGGGGRIFDSPAFFDVSPLDSSNQRTFLPHTPGLIRALSLRAAQVGPNGLQMIRDRAGQMLQVAPAEKGAKLMVRDVTGKTVEVVHARLERDGRPILLDEAGNVIQVQRSVPQTAAREAGNQVLTARKFIIDRIPIFLDPSLAVIDVEQGQADGGVLRAQNGSLVYYSTMVNDVYAYFATGTKDGGISPAPTHFPINSSDLGAITTFASAHGKTFPDPNALAVEVKAAWVEAAGLPNASSYITMTATIPTYDESNPDTWTPNGQKTVQLALVGVHVVGSTGSTSGHQGHPEMIWSTFEHFANAPRAAYAYINTSGATTTVAQNTAANWLFCANNSSGPFNSAHMQASGANIVSVPPFHITPSDTLRSKPFGMDGTSQANSNTEVISMNNHVRGMLVSGDVRSNYIMTGATWTIFGAPPSGGDQVGTSQLSNTTMETYQQGTNCFTCHSQPMLGTAGGSGLSHVFGPLKPLF